MPQKIQIGHFTIVFDPESLKIEFAGFAFLKRVGAINEITAWVILPDVIETTVQVFHVNRRLEILHQQKGRPEENHMTMVGGARSEPDWHCTGIGLAVGIRTEVGEVV